MILLAILITVCIAAYLLHDVNRDRQRLGTEREVLPKVTPEIERAHARIQTTVKQLQDQQVL
jgi:hypothetical protein